MKFLFKFSYLFGNNWNKVLKKLTHVQEYKNNWRKYYFDSYILESQLIQYLHFGSNQFGSYNFRFANNLVFTVNLLTENAYVANDMHYDTLGPTKFNRTNTSTFSYLSILFHPFFNTVHHQYHLHHPIPLVASPLRLLCSLHSSLCRLAPGKLPHLTWCPPQ